MWVLVLSVGLALVHLMAGGLRFLSVEPRSRWLSLAGGISVAYVFAHLLPQVAAGQEALAEVGAARLVVGEGHVWLLALLGLVVFYGLERAALVSRADDADDEASAGVFWIHMASYGLYNALIGYLLTHGEAKTGTKLGLFWVAMALHVCVNDAGLRAHHRATYDRVGRWGLAAAVVAGTAVGLWTAVHPAVVAGLVAFLAGGVVLNTLKEELPEERASRFWPFALGAAGYAALLTVV